MVEEAELDASTGDSDKPDDAPLVQRRPRSGSEGLDFLVALAERERCAVAPVVSSNASNSSSGSSASSDDDSDSMPPPPPRNRRPRSASNPEATDLWGSSVSSSYRSSSRPYFVLPASILEEELAEARVAVRDFRQCRRSPPTIPEDSEYLEGDAENLAPSELLRRARSRLLEDLSESSLTGEKGFLTLPHALAKYKEVRSIFI